MIFSLKSENLWTKINIIWFIFLVILINIGILFENYLYVAVGIIFQIVLIIIFNFRKYYIEILIVSIIFAKILYWPFRIYLVLIFSVFLIFFYYSYYREDIFNKLKVPLYLKISASFLIISVFLSSVLTPYISIYSIFYSIIYFLFMITSYIIFKSILSSDKILKILDLFVLLVFISGLTKIYFVINTGLLRSLGISEFYYMDFAPIALLIIFFLYYIYGKFNSKNIFFAIIIFLTVIADQSRFAWLGLIISLIYGLIISFIYSSEARYFIKKRITAFIIFIVISIGLLFVFGLDKVIITRVSEVHLNFFQEPDKIQEGQYVSNSLEARILIWITGYNTFIHHPITGVGYFMFLEVSENYNVLPQIIYDLYVKDLDAHTVYFNFLVDTGILGLTAYIIYVIMIFTISYKTVIISSGYLRRVSIMLNILMFHMIFNSIYAGSYNLVPSGFLFHFIVALTVANYLILKINQKDRINVYNDYQNINGLHY